MKHFFAIIALFMTINAFAFVHETPITVAGLPETAFQGMTADNFTSMSAADAAKVVGRDLTLREKVSLKAAQKAVKKSSSKEPDDMKLITIILAFVLSPVAVYLHQGDFTRDFWINLALYIFCLWIGGVIHALYIINKK
jgi:uncharacterized membrane protein YqaE (UPF0057 family)